MKEPSNIIKSEEKEPVKIVERGWLENIPNAEKCYFHRNTLLQCHAVRLIVVTIGNYHPNGEERMQPLEEGQYYQTMVFRAHRHERYWFINPKKRMWLKECDKPRFIDHASYSGDFEANLMHKKWVRWIERQFEMGVDYSEPKPKKKPKHWRKRG